MQAWAALGRGCSSGLGRGDGFIQPVVVFAGLFGVVHGAVGIMEQGLGVDAAGRVKRNTDTGGDERLLPVDHECTCQRFQYFLRHLFRVMASADIGQQRNKLVAAEASDSVGVTYAPHEAFGGDAEQLIADGMALRVIDGLEAVEIDKQHRQHLTLAASLSQLLLQAVIEQQAIGRAGERITALRETLVK